MAVAYMADGSSVPLRSWSLSYEYLTWPQGASPVMGSTARRDARDLWIGKRTLPAAGTTLEIVYGETESEREVDGATRTVRRPLARELSLTTADGKKLKLAPEPPPRRLLLPEADRKAFVQARSLDLRGETITGTRRELCLLTYTSMVECGDTPENRVVKVEFH